ncbi:transposase family protein [Streptomyces mutabilis]|uniref:transposase family protein n=1 Tax=Streptomyces mutabilis TaxID=67332 RepID=UPI0034DFE228
MVHLRTGLPHAALAELYGTARSTVSRATGEIRPLVAARGFAVPDRPAPECGCARWRTCSPTPKPRGSG